MATKKKQSLLFKIRLSENEVDFNINDFIDLFLKNGPFEDSLNEIYGIATHNFNLNIYSVTFKDTTEKSIIDNLYETHHEPQSIKLNSGLQIFLQINRPPGYRQVVTLYPMPFDITPETVKQITTNWGVIKSYDFGKHKKCPQIRNPYLHIFVENLRRSAIPEAINFRNRFVSVSIDGEQPLKRCGYCKASNHELDHCPNRLENEKKRKSRNQTDQNHLQTTYASTIKSPRNQEIIQHPVTTLKIKKKAIENNNMNFPPLLQKKNTEPFQENAKISSMSLNNTIQSDGYETDDSSEKIPSQTSSQPLLDLQPRATSPSSTRNATTQFQTPIPKTKKKKTFEKEKRKHSTTPSPTIAPNKKISKNEI